MKEWQKALKARGWMKKNESFLSTWHAYVGNELNLFRMFEKPKTVREVVDETGLSEELLDCWVQIGAVVHHLRKRTGNRYRTSKKNCGEFLSSEGAGIGALLKEVMELHIPTLLSYPTYMTSNERAVFNHDRFGSVVAETSSLLENFAIKRIKRIVQEENTQTVVDLGCGYGGYLRKLTETFPTVDMVGVDLNEDVVAYARQLSKEYSNIQFEVGDASTWHPSTGEVDLVLIHNIFHYLDLTSRQQLLRHISKWISKDGKISVITPINDIDQSMAFPKVFNGFFTAHSNLHPLPTVEGIQEMAHEVGLTISKFQPIVREGGWYSYWLTPQQTDVPLEV
ncbi:methyltransferase type 12 [Pontibacillus halophilus JSM 076056 = DSM 19796]|uniref:Methyltransferase type 12 n=1 Tax=Pontibacillus halophilus JSM 076056 = DSM 19796 TaxID=1385510 RepID=A0A0A5GP47_9BACI|nr:class I SAM-dependent methyltransferase [Pontibacillus halophilus]KGX92945.1 methyltransferase type 12 [Pontibacillus halophilus JSM 076056 = DSM 19796]